jgi:alanine dehydrogenase
VVNWLTVFATHVAPGGLPPGSVTNMIFLDAGEVRKGLDWPSLKQALSVMFRDGCVAPRRHHHTIDVPDGPPATLLLMPAWNATYLGVKYASVYPDNARVGLPAVSAFYLLASGRTGRVLAMIDGSELTVRRTAAASALAARFLAREASSRLLIVGTGRLSAALACAHADGRQLQRVAVWGRNAEKAARVAAELAEQGLPAEVASELSDAVAGADIVSCATLSTTPLIRGEWLRPGTHLDLVGGFTPDMRETDDEAARRSCVFVDTREGAGTEAGDIVVPLGRGILRPEDIRADLHELARGRHPGRRDADEITMFKSVGAALEDLAAAILVYERRAGGTMNCDARGAFDVDATRV